MKIAVTGSNGSLGCALVARLKSAGHNIVAIDIARPPGPEGVSYRQCDVRSAEIGQHFVGCDVVVHLAFVVETGSRDTQAVEEINVGGTKNVLTAAADAGVKNIVYASSIAAYGAHAENLSGPLSEEAPIRGNREFYYSRTKADVERWCDDFEAAHQNVTLTRLRPSIFLAPDAKRSLDWLKFPLLPYFRGSSCPVHVTHQEDVVSAFVLAIEKGLGGTFNIATDEPIPVREWATRLGKRSVPVPQTAIRLLDAGYRTGRVHVDPAWMRFGIKYPIVVDSKRAKDVLGWKPKYQTTESVLRALLDSQEGARERPEVLLSILSMVTRMRGSLAHDEVSFGGIEGDLNFELTGPRSSTWHLWVKEGRVGFGRGRSENARATVTISTENFARLLTGQLEWVTAGMLGQLSLEGDGGFMMIGGGVVATLRRAIQERSDEPRPSRWAKSVLKRAMRMQGEAQR